MNTFKKGDLVVFDVVKLQQSLTNLKEMLSGNLEIPLMPIVKTAKFIGAIEDTGNCVIEYDDTIRVVKISDLRLSENNIKKVDSFKNLQKDETIVELTFNGITESIDAMRKAEFDIREYYNISYKEDLTAVTKECSDLNKEMKVYRGDELLATITQVPNFNKFSTTIKITYAK